MAVIFEMVKYHHQSYPEDIPLRIEEVATHFDVSYVSGEMDWSLHTEYSYGKRKLTQKRLTYYHEILGAQKDGVPQLWKNEQWAREFADYIVTLVGERRAPKVIEIHPPFNDYTDMDQFLSDYSVFETSIQKQFPEIQILIENRCGSVYRGGKFLISKNQDIELLCEGIDRNKLALQIAYDIPQIYTAHNAKLEKHYIELLS